MWLAASFSRLATLPKCVVKVCKVLTYYVRMVQAHRTSLNLREPHQDRASNLCKVLMH